MSDTKPLTRSESRLVSAIVASPDAKREDIAAELKWSVRHVRRLLAKDHVRKALDGAARDGLAAASGVLGRNAQRAADALVAMATGGSRASAPRVAAARAVLDVGARLLDPESQKITVTQSVTYTDRFTSMTRAELQHEVARLEAEIAAEEAEIAAKASAGEEGRTNEGPGEEITR